MDAVKTPEKEFFGGIIFAVGGLGFTSTSLSRSEVFRIIAGNEAFLTALQKIDLSDEEDGTLNIHFHPNGEEASTVLRQVVKRFRSIEESA